jgi:hypothetical protein
MATLPSNAYTGLIPGYNATQPIFSQWVYYLTQPYALLNAFCVSLLTTFDLDVAVGAQLDIIGLWVGVTRQVAVPITGIYFTWGSATLGWGAGVWQGPYDPNSGVYSLDDYHYRFLLYARIAANQWDGKRGTAVAAYNLALTPTGATAQITDNHNMTIIVTVQGPLTQLMTALISGGYIPLVPLGVSATYVFTG